jgi:hypothetical protein
MKIAVLALLVGILTCNAKRPSTRPGREGWDRLGVRRLAVPVPVLAEPLEP